jgi:hypothetical protein
MVRENNHRNVFEVVYESDWCWRMGCTTCGNTSFEIQETQCSTDYREYVLELVYDDFQSQ